MLLNGNNNELSFVVVCDTNYGRTLEHMHKAYEIIKRQICKTILAIHSSWIIRSNKTEEENKKITESIRHNNLTRTTTYILDE